MISPTRLRREMAKPTSASDTYSELKTATTESSSQRICLNQSSYTWALHARLSTKHGRNRWRESYLMNDDEEVLIVCTTAARGCFVGGRRNVGQQLLSTEHLVELKVRMIVCPQWERRARSVAWHAAAALCDGSNTAALTDRLRVAQTSLPVGACRFRRAKRVVILATWPLRLGVRAAAGGGGVCHHADGRTRRSCGTNSRLGASLPAPNSVGPSAASAHADSTLAATARFAGR